MKPVYFCMLASLLAASAHAAPPTTAPASSNETAAVCRQAFELLDRLSSDDKRRLGLCGTDGCWVVTTPLDRGALDLVMQQAKAIALARRAASMPPAEWAIDGDAQRMVDLANRGPRLSALLVLQARHEFRDGQTKQGLDDVVAAMALSRHFATDATIMAKLVETAAWRPAADVLAQQLPSLPKDVVAALPARLAKLPPSPTMRETIIAEKAYAKRSAKRQGVSMVIMVASLNDFYDATAASADLPPDAFAKVVDEQAAKYPLNPWGQVIAPAMKSSRASLAVLEAKQGMLATAIDIVTRGENAVKHSKDPFGTGPFAFRKRAAGFELESALKSHDEPVKLLVGS